MKELLLVFVSVLFYYPLCISITSFFIRKLGYKEEGFFFVLFNLLLISIEGTCILLIGPNAALYFIVIPALILIGASYHDKNKTIEL